MHTCTVAAVLYIIILAIQPHIKISENDNMIIFQTAELCYRKSIGLSADIQFQVSYGDGSCVSLFEVKRRGQHCVNVHPFSYDT